MLYKTRLPALSQQYAAVYGIGLASGKSVDQDETARQAAAHCCTSRRQTRILKEAYRLTRIESRGSVLAEENDALFGDGVTVSQSPFTGQRMEVFARKITPLAVNAAKLALSNTEIPSSITHLFTVTCTGFFAPGFDIALIKELGLSSDVARTQIGFMGCHGGLNAMRAASSVIRSDPGARILLCAAELCSLHFQYGWDANNLLANSLFADGAAAVVLAPSVVAADNWTLVSSGSHIVPDSEGAMTWTIGDNGFTMTLSKSVPDLIRKHLPEWLDSWLKSHGLSVSDVPSWAIHPGGPRILDCVAECLSLGDEQMAPSREVLYRFGNMSSPTVFFILHRLRMQQAPRPCVVLGFGPGLAIEAALFF